MVVGGLLVARVAVGAFARVLHGMATKRTLSLRIAAITPARSECAEATPDPSIKRDTPLHRGRRALQRTLLHLATPREPRLAGGQQPV